MTLEIVIEMTGIKDTSDFISEQVLSWAKRIEAQQSQKVVIESLREMESFHMIWKSKPRTDQKQNNSKSNTKSPTQSTKMWILWNHQRQ